MMTQTTETSVMFALAELQRTEVARQAEEVATRRRQEQEERERIERERAQAREAELQARRVAEAAARLRVEVEAREAAARERVAAMQQALIQLKAERDVLQEHLQAREPATPAVAPPVVRWAMSGMALSLIAVAAMAVVLLTPPARVRTHEVSGSRATQAAAPGLVAPVLALSPPPVAALLPKPPVSGPRPKPPHRGAPVHVPVTQPDPTACGDDPICGMKFK